MATTPPSDDFVGAIKDRLLRLSAEQADELKCHSHITNGRSEAAQSAEDDLTQVGDDESFYEEKGAGLCPLPPSVVDYEFENGRRYHAYRAGRYPLPNDERELERLDLQYHMIKLLMHGELFMAPLRKKSVRRALDVGTGTGLWAIEFGDMFPDALVTGIDLSPVQPEWCADSDQCRR